MKKLTNNKYNIISICILLALTTGLGLTLSSNPFSNRLLGHDSSMFMYFGEGIKQGMIPYKEMLDHKGPVLFFINSIASIGFNENHMGLWLIELTSIFVTLFFTYKTSLLFTNKGVSLLAIILSFSIYISTLDTGNYSEEYAMPFIMLSLYYFFDQVYHSRKLQNFHFIIIGFSFSFVFFIRANMIVPWIVIYSYYLIMYFYQKKWLPLFKVVFYSFLGAMIICIPVVFYCIITGSLAEMIQQAFLMNLQYASSSLWEKLSTSNDFYNVLASSGYPVMIFLFLSLLLKNLQNKKVRRSYLLLLALNILNWYTVILSGRSYQHYMLTQVGLLTIIVAIVLFEYFKNYDLKKWIIVFSLFIILFSPLFYTSIQRIKYINTAEFPMDREKEAIAREIREHSKKGDRIYVHAIDGNIYLLSHRFSNSKFFVLPSLNYIEQPELSKEFLSSFDKDMPKYIVIMKDAKVGLDSLFNKEILALVSKKGKLEYQTESYILYKMQSN